MSRRYRRKRSSDTGGLFVFLFALAIVEVIYHNKDFIGFAPYAIYAAAVLVGLGLIIFAYRTFKKIQLRRRLATLEEVDFMSGLEFEEYVASLLRRHGFKKVSLTE